LKFISVFERFIFTPKGIFTGITTVSPIVSSEETDCRLKCFLWNGVLVLSDLFSETTFFGFYILIFLGSLASIPWIDFIFSKMLKLLHGVKNGWFRL
jgi:hypothetical protein